MNKLILALVSLACVALTVYATPSFGRDFGGFSGHHAVPFGGGYGRGGFSGFSGFGGVGGGYGYGGYGYGGGIGGGIGGGMAGGRAGGGGIFGILIFLFVFIVLIRLLFPTGAGGAGGLIG